jgi:hypothetical protein
MLAACWWPWLQSWLQCDLATGCDPLLLLCCAPQEYIQIENARLEAEQQFWAKEIVVKIEYKFCPNLTIIDTPGGRQQQQQRRVHCCCLVKLAGC